MQICCLHFSSFILIYLILSWGHVELLSQRLSLYMYKFPISGQHGSMFWPSKHFNLRSFPTGVTLSIWVSFAVQRPKKYQKRNTFWQEAQLIMLLKHWCFQSCGKFIWSYHWKCEKGEILQYHLSCNRCAWIAAINSIQTLVFWWESEGRSGIRFWEIYRHT